MPRNRAFSFESVVALFVLLGMDAARVADELRADHLDALKAEAKKQWKQRAFSLHPDRGGDESEFKRVAEAHETIQALVPVQSQVIQAPVVRGPAWRGVTIIFGGGASTGTTTTGSWGGFRPW